MKFILSLIITCTILTTLKATDIGYDITNFKPTDLREYFLTPYLSNTIEYNDLKDHGYGSSQDNGLFVKGSLKFIQPDYEFQVSSDNQAAIFAIKNGFYINNYDYNDYRKFWQKRLFSANQVEYKKYSDNHFIGLEYTNTYTYSNSTLSEYDYPDESVRRKHWILDNRLAAIIGNGRLFECQEAYTAWFFFKELEKNGCLNKPYSETNIEEIATALYKLRSLHEIDSRRSYVNKAMILMDELKSKDYLKAGTETKAAAILMELWQQGDRTERLNGTRIEAKPFVAVSDYVRRAMYIYEGPYYSDSVERFYQADVGLELTLRYERPIRNIYQMSGSLSIRHGFYDSFDNNSYGESVIVNWEHFTHAAASYSISCYPDCRSMISLGAKANYYSNNVPKIFISYGGSSFLLAYDKMEKLDGSINLNAQYQITYRLALNGNISGTLLYMHEKGHSVYQETNFNTSLNLGYRLY